jgi:serine/threonine protein kinase
MVSGTDATGSEGDTREVRGVLAAGTCLRSYEVVSVLGQGAFGVTYRARDTQLGRDVAIKEYLPTALALREGRTTVVPRSTEHAQEFVRGRERFLEEARTLARFEGTPGIIPVYDFLEANGTAYMVMALARGITLERLLRSEGPLPQVIVERLLFPLLDGLEKVHGSGFLHRDIKPANIIVDARGGPILIDFGAARAAIAGGSTTPTAIFTPGFAAAEQFTSSTLGPWTDIYGLAATLYTAITGTVPPRAIDRLFDDRYQPLAALRPAGFAPALLSALDAALAVRANQRPQSIASWRSMLSDAPPSSVEPASGEATAKAAAPGGARRDGLARPDGHEQSGVSGRESRRGQDDGKGRPAEAGRGITRRGTRVRKAVWIASLLLSTGAVLWVLGLVQPPEASLSCLLSGLTAPEGDACHAARPAPASACDREKSLRSLAGDQSTSISFTNDGAEAVRLYWLDYNGDRVPYGTVAPGTTVLRQTYVTHPWVVADTSDKCRAIYLPAPEPRHVVVGR